MSEFPPRILRITFLPFEVRIPSSDIKNNISTIWCQNHIILVHRHKTLSKVGSQNPLDGWGTSLGFHTDWYMSIRSEYKHIDHVNDVLIHQLYGYHSALAWVSLLFYDTLLSHSDVMGNYSEEYLTDMYHLARGLQRQSDGATLQMVPYLLEFLPPICGLKHKLNIVYLTTL